MNQKNFEKLEITPALVKQALGLGRLSVGTQNLVSLLIIHNRAKAKNVDYQSISELLSAVLAEFLNNILNNPHLFLELEQITRVERMMYPEDAEGTEELLLADQTITNIEDACTVA